MTNLPANRLVYWANYRKIDLEWASSFVEPAHMTAWSLEEDIDLEHYRPFEEFVRAVLGSRTVIVSRYVGIWDSSSISDRDSRFCRGFPHSHNNDLGTISVVIQAPIDGGRALLNDEYYDPEPGRGLIIGGREIHGVTRVVGPRPRIALIAQFQKN